MGRMLVAMLALMVALAAAHSSNDCQRVCARHYDAKRESEECETGCRLLFAIAGANNENALKTCHQDCGLALKGPGMERCKVGCNLGHSLEQEREHEMASHSAFFPMSESLFDFDSLFPQPRGLTFDLEAMHERMRQQMRNFMSGFGDFGNFFNRKIDANGNQVGEGRGGGKLVVVQAGPGYFERKSYRLGPDGNIVEEESEDNEKLKQIGHHNDQESGRSDEQDKEGENERDQGEEFSKAEVEPLNDMMHKPNPLDDSFDSDDVEEVKKPLRVRILSPFASWFGNTNRDLHVDDGEFGPRLPESGLKTRHMTLEEMCQRAREDRWPEWMTCLHVRSGMPRWITLCSFGLLLLFVFWLCLVLPARSSRRSNHKYWQPFVTPKEIESLSAVCENGPPSYSKLDLPPNYEDIASLHVAVATDEEHDDEVKENKGEEVKKTDTDKANPDETKA